MELLDQIWFSLKSPGNLPNPGIKTGSPALLADALLPEPLGKSFKVQVMFKNLRRDFFKPKSSPHYSKIPVAAYPWAVPSCLVFCGVLPPSMSLLWAPGPHLATVTEWFSARNLYCPTALTTMMLGDKWYLWASQMGVKILKPLNLDLLIWYFWGLDQEMDNLISSPVILMCSHFEYYWPTPGYIPHREFPSASWMN